MIVFGNCLLFIMQRFGFVQTDLRMSYFPFVVFFSLKTCGDAFIRDVYIIQLKFQQACHASIRFVVRIYRSVERLLCIHQIPPRVILNSALWLISSFQRMKEYEIHNFSFCTVFFFIVCTSACSLHAWKSWFCFALQEKVCPYANQIRFRWMTRPWPHRIFKVMREFAKF